MNKKKGTRGAISVFLAIILVPCIVVSSVFVDLSRVHLSKATAESAADLALNALLTNYDADLKDWYGMVASCQTIKEFYEVSANYFLRMLSSQGMSDAEIILLSDYYANATGDDTIYDLLKVESQSGASGMITPVKDANLSNASLIKDQVIEFMKYRAPIEITTNIVERFKADSSIGAALEADENEPLVEDKQEFFEAEGKLTEGAYYSYVAIYKYFNKANTAKMDNAALASKYDKFEGYKNAYEDILGYLVTNLTNTSGLSRYSRPTCTLTYYNDDYSNPSKKFSEVYSERKKVDGVYQYYIDLTDVKELVGALDTAIKNFDIARSNFATAAQSVMDQLPYGTGANQANAIQWWVRMNQAVNSGSKTQTEKVKEAGQNMLRAYSRVLAIDSCELRGTAPKDWTDLSDWKTEYNVDALLQKVTSRQGTYLTSGVTSTSDKYLKAVKQLESVSSSNAGNINASNLYVTVDGQRKNLESALSYISQQLTNMRSEINGYIDVLDVAIDGDDGDTPSLDELKSLAKKYDTKLGEWKTTAQNTTTAMGDADEDEIATQVETVEVDEAQVNALKTRLKNIRSQFQDLVDAIDSLKFGGKAIKDIKTVSEFKNKASGKISSSNIKLKNSQLTSYAATVFGQLFVPKTLPTMKHANDTSYNLTIHPVTKKENTPEFFVYLYEKYGRVSDEEVKSAKDDQEKATKQGDEKAEKAKNKDRYKGGGKDVKWEYSGSQTAGLDSVLKGTIGVVENLINGNFTGMRDDLYATTYIMEMFSYATYENEGKYRLLSEEDQKKLTLSNMDEYYKNVTGENADSKKTWLSADPQDYYNKSLTNKLINKSNNAAYLAEVEYILFGGNGSKNVDNVKKMYTNIYAIRYGLNLVSGFQHFWNPAGTNTDPTAMVLFAVGSSVSALTLGVVPIAVTEAVLIPILTIFETCNDLERLEAGFPVELYKTEAGQWWVSLSSDDSTNIGAVMSALMSGDFSGKTNTGEGFFYSDYLMLFVYMGMNESASASMYQRMAEIIQFNIGTMAKKDDYSLKKSQMYFTLNAELRVKPLMITMPIFNDYENNMDTATDWCTYEITTVRGYS